ncbi:MAG: hypothetical protein RLZZ01_2526, partial [Actinomycetota bacterium]
KIPQTINLTVTVLQTRPHPIFIWAVAKHGVTIGDDTVVGANSYVDRDLDGCLVAFGTPARTIRARRPADRYLG